MLSIRLVATFVAPLLLLACGGAPAPSPEPAPTAAAKSAAVPSAAVPSAAAPSAAPVTPEPPRPPEAKAGYPLQPLPEEKEQPYGFRGIMLGDTCSTRDDFEDISSAYAAADPKMRSFKRDHEDLKVDDQTILALHWQCLDDKLFRVNITLQETRDALDAMEAHLTTWLGKPSKREASVLFGSGYELDAQWRGGSVEVRLDATSYGGTTYFTHVYIADMAGEQRLKKE